MTGVVIVTYADRKKFLEQVIERLLKEPAINIIYVVGNNTPYSLADFLQSFKSQKTHHHSFDKNTGSANGYKYGIRQLEKIQEIKNIWLLDDDNLPANNALANLIDYWDKNNLDKSRDALMCLRTDRPYLVQVAHGKPVNFYFPKKNAFLGFHAFRIHEFFIKKLFLKYNSNNKKEVMIPCAPYGGLFFNKELVQNVGYPDERFFVYADDYEFTYRITKSGGKIILIPQASVDDLEKTWLIKTKHGAFHSRYLEQNDFRVYTSVRNTVYLQKKYLVNNKPLYRINTFCFMIHILLLAITGNKMQQYRNFRKAVKDGNTENFDNTYFYDN